MFRRILFAALVAGFAAGLVATGLQVARLWPLILKAETYEQAQAPVTLHAPGQALEHAAWEPADGPERMGFTLLFNLLAGVGFALLLNGALALRDALSPPSQSGEPGGRRVDPSTGLLWGLAGFAAASLAPALGLPPELPGMAAADLAARQVWWLATALATAGGIAMIAFAPASGRAWKPFPWKMGAWRIAGAALILAPHALGAPETLETSAGVPAELAAEFAVASLVAAAAFWVVLGGVSGWVQRRLAG